MSKFSYSGGPVLRWSGTPVVRYSGKSTGAMKNLEPWNKETGITELACADICTSLFVCIMLVFNIYCYANDLGWSGKSPGAVVR